MESGILCAMTILNILMLAANVWMRHDSEKTPEEIKEKTDCRGLRPRNDGGGR